MYIGLIIKLFSQLFLIFSQQNKNCQIKKFFMGIFESYL